MFRPVLEGGKIISKFIITLLLLLGLSREKKNMGSSLIKLMRASYDSHDCDCPTFDHRERRISSAIFSANA